MQIGPSSIPRAKYFFENIQGLNIDPSSAFEFKKFHPLLIRNIFDTAIDKCVPQLNFSKYGLNF